MMVAEMIFRKLNAPNLVVDIAQGKKYDNQMEIRVVSKSFYPPDDNVSLLEVATTDEDCRYYF